MLVAAAALAPLSPAAAPRPHRAPPQRVVVRTELVPANDGFDWLDAAAGFGLAIVSIGVVLLVVAGRRPPSLNQWLPTGWK